MANPLEILAGGCNLFRRGTHAIVNDDDKGLIYVSRKDRAFQLSDAFVATFVAKVDFDDPEGCANCPVYGKCLPIPKPIKTGNILRAAQQTSFTSDDIPGMQDGT
jgi:hypothetical protein